MVSSSDNYCGPLPFLIEKHEGEYSVDDRKPLQRAKNEGKRGNALEIRRQFVQRYSEFLEYVQQILQDASINRVTVIDSRQDKGTGQGLGCVSRKILANVTDSAELQAFYSAKVQNKLLETQRSVENDTETANRWKTMKYNVTQLVSQLVFILSQVNHKGLHHGQKQCSIRLLFTLHASHQTTNYP